MILNRSKQIEKTDWDEIRPVSVVVLGIDEDYEAMVKAVKSALNVLEVYRCVAEKSGYSQEYLGRVVEEKCEIVVGYLGHILRGEEDEEVKKIKTLLGPSFSVQMVVFPTPGKTVAWDLKLDMGPFKETIARDKPKARRILFNMMLRYLTWDRVLIIEPGKKVTLRQARRSLSKIVKMNADRYSKAVLNTRNGKPFLVLRVPLGL
jgi:hypothetical protein